MSIIGKSLAHYQITAEIGKGRMGEVYKATDTKLGRSVAIKVLPEEFARDTDRVARFEREAKLLASLNHPNIAAIYGLEKSEGTNFLVMELIEGETLAERIKAGPIPVEEALKLSLQISEALEAAHEKGIIHRDLKPANIKVTPEGKIKVLDFGLAKAFAGEQTDFNLSNSPTLSDAVTQAGVILGTAAYMAPEQAKGKSVDKRADIWAFGVVVFEMLSGRQLFVGETVSETLAAVLMKDVDFGSLPPNLHPRVKEMLERCLQKDPKERYSGMGDARFDLQKVLGDPRGVFVQPGKVVEPQRKLRIMLPWIAAAIILTAVIIGSAVWLLKPSSAPGSKQVRRDYYELPEDQQFFKWQNIVPLALSPDGNQFAYSTTKGIYIRSLKDLDATLISGSDDDAGDLFFSPDAQWIGYFSASDQKLKRISVSGGKPMDICDAPMIYGAAWYEDNTIVYSDFLSGIYRVSYNGGTPKLLVEGMTAAPLLLPDRKSVMFIDFSTGSSKTVVQSLDSKERRVVFETGATYLPSGHLWSAPDSIRSGSFVTPFDLDKLVTIGGSIPLNLLMDGKAVSKSGTLIYIPGTTNTRSGTASPKRTFVWVDKKGNAEPLIGAEADDYDNFRISPDGTKVAMTIITGNNSEISVWDIARKTPMRLNNYGKRDSDPLWTPDSQRIVFASDRGNVFGSIHWRKADGTGLVEELLSIPNRQLAPWSLSSDGKTLALFEGTTSPRLDIDIGMMSMEGNRARTELLHEKYAEAEPQISPNGRFIAYTSYESGKPDVFVRPLPDVDSERWPISNSGGHSPLWDPNGKELYYRIGDSTMVVPVETEPTFKPGIPEILFQGTYYSPFADIGALRIESTSWDVHPTNGRFLMLKPVAETKEAAAEEPRKIVIVTNWFEELKELAPVD